ncbi:hypothetical protein SAMN02745121_07444 [Nannocystis exedens]|uniref:Uncharacterized protein n=1 Tax=Nannocystis exedens TaxID=54 RepID=A0A1I2GST0_9BACT|nr:hypothetical protein [Nannocystis exedens]PCC68747.1 hypothetical protein NAEX_01764 [Nannocystis exedens]SFF19611.1 hypothetical protein SAMN02745121_07444 [Nannocystis exedens]
MNDAPRPVSLETWRHTANRQFFFGDALALAEDFTHAPHDRAATTWDGRYANDPWEEGPLGVAPGVIGVVLPQDASVPIFVELRADAPPARAPEATWVVEASVEIGHGGAVLVTDGDEKRDEFPVESGTYMVRVSRLGAEGSTSPVRYVLQVYPGAALPAPRVLHDEAHPGQLRADADWTTLEPLPVGGSEAQLSALVRSDAPMGRRLWAIEALAASNLALAWRTREQLVFGDKLIPVAYELLTQRGGDDAVGADEDEGSEAEEEDEDASEEGEDDDEGASEEGEEDADEEEDASEEDEEDEEDEENEADDAGDDEDDKKAGDAGEEFVLSLDVTGVPAEASARVGRLVRLDADNLFHQCNQQRDENFPGEAPFISGVLTNWGFFPATARIAEHVRSWSNWESAVALARAVAAALKDVVYSTDSDVPYYPFVAPADSLDELRAALGLGARETLRIDRPFATRTGRKARDNIFYARNEQIRVNPEIYFSPGDRAALAKADRLLRAASPEVMYVYFNSGYFDDEDRRYVVTPEYALARLPGFVAGVVTFGVFT